MIVTIAEETEESTNEGEEEKNLILLDDYVMVMFVECTQL